MATKKKTGRKKKPLALTLIESNPGKRKRNLQEPKSPKLYKPKAPAGFNKLQTAKWNELAGQLALSRVLTELDRDALEIYVRNWIEMHEALKDLSVRGKLLRTAKGAPMWNPSWSQYKHSEQVCRSLMSEFGMTPSSRTNIVAGGDGEGKSLW